MEDELASHKDTLGQHNRRLTDLASFLHENTELTKKSAALSQRTADNTAEIVTLFKEVKVIFKWGVVFKRFVIWSASVVTGVIYFWDSIVRFITER